MAHFTQLWSPNDELLGQRKKEVETLLRSKGIAVDTSACEKEPCRAIGSDFIEKCLYFTGGDISLAVVACRRLLNFRTSVGWPLCLPLPTDGDAGAMRSGLFYLLTDRHGRAVFVFDFARLAAAAASLDNSGISASGGSADTSVDGSGSSSSGSSSGGIKLVPNAIERLQKIGMYLMEQITDQQESMRRGVVLLVDCRGTSKATFSGVGLADAQRGSKMWAGFPVKLKCVLVVGLSPAMATVVRGLMFATVSERMRRRVFFLPSLDYSPGGGPAMLDTEIGFDFLPPTLGGTLRSDARSLSGSPLSEGVLITGRAWREITDAHFDHGAPLWPSPV